MNDDLELIAGVVHGVQAFGYIEGFIYHRRKNHRLETWLCAAMIPYHVWAVFRHLGRVDGTRLPK